MIAGKSRLSPSAGHSKSQGWIAPPLACFTAALNAAPSNARTLVKWVHRLATLTAVSAPAVVARRLMPAASAVRL